MRYGYGAVTVGLRSAFVGATDFAASCRFILFIQIHGHLLDALARRVEAADLGPGVGEGEDEARVRQLYSQAEPIAGPVSLLLAKPRGGHPSSKIAGLGSIVTTSPKQNIHYVSYIIAYMYLDISFSLRR